MGKTIQSGERNIILKVIQYFEQEKRNRDVLFPVSKAIQRACMATGHSKATLLRIKKEAEIELAKIVASTEDSGQEISNEKPPSIILPTPGKKRKPSSKKIELNSFNLCALKNIINRFYASNEVPTIKKILAAAKADINFPGGMDTLRKIMKYQLGYRFKKVKNKSDETNKKDQYMWLADGMYSKHKPKTLGNKK